MLVCGRVTPSFKFAGTHLYTWVERATVRVRCLALARAWTWTAQFRGNCTNHEGIAPPFINRYWQINAGGEPCGEPCGGLHVASHQWGSSNTSNIRNQEKLQLCTSHWRAWYRLHITCITYSQMAGCMFGNGGLSLNILSGTHSVFPYIHLTLSTLYHHGKDWDTLK